MKLLLTFLECFDVKYLQITSKHFEEIHHQNSTNQIYKMLFNKTF